MDILKTLPDFPTRSFTNLLPSLERNQIATSDILLFEPNEIAKQAQLPPREVTRLRDAILDALRLQLGLLQPQLPGDSETDPSTIGKSLACSGSDVLQQWKTVSTLDDGLDAALGGGFPTGRISELTGQSGAGKTQFLLTLLLAAQLPRPHGLERAALYISTEAPLATTRLQQILDHHPRLAALPAASKPSLSRILSIQTPDLESQEHILRFQLPVAVKRHNIGLVVIDSITANYRAELDTSETGRRGIAGLAKRSAQLVELGAILRSVARGDDVAIVVANQVADRFAHETSIRTTRPVAPEGEQRLYSSPRTQSSGIETEDADEGLNPMTLEHQQRWFTGWGDGDPGHHHDLKTPSLGLVWTNEISCRVALIKRNAVGRDPETSRWRRFMKVVFAPWCPSADGSRGIEFEISKEGLKSVDKNNKELIS